MGGTAGLVLRARSVLTISSALGCPPSDPAQLDQRSRASACDAAFMPFSAGVLALSGLADDDGCVLLVRARSSRGAPSHLPVPPQRRSSSPCPTLPVLSPSAAVRTDQLATPAIPSSRPPPPPPAYTTDGSGPLAARPRAPIGLRTGPLGALLGQSPPSPPLSSQPPGPSRHQSLLVRTSS